MAEDSSADAACQELNGAVIDGQEIKVDRARGGGDRPAALRRRRLRRCHLHGSRGCCFQGLLRRCIQVSVAQCVFDDAPNHELHGQVIDPSTVVGVGGLRGLDPGIGDITSRKTRESGHPIKGLSVLRILADHIVQGVEDIVLQGLRGNVESGGSAHSFVPWFRF